MQCVWNFLDNPYQQLKRALLRLLLRFLLDDLQLLKGPLSAQMGNFHLTYIHMFIYQLICIIDIFRWIVNSLVLYYFFRQPYYYFTPITPYSIFIFLPLFNLEPPFFHLPHQITYALIFPSLSISTPNPSNGHFLLSPGFCSYSITCNYI